MANYKLPPRQKMINLLYIILIAMLAINISSDVLDGFHTASRDMQRNVEGLKAYSSVLSKAAADQGLGQQAQQLEQQANEMADFIAVLKKELKEETKRNSMTGNDVDADDDLNAVETVMLGNNAEKATLLKKSIENLKESCLNLTQDPAVKSYVENLLSTQPLKEGSRWEAEHFDNLPTIGAYMMLNKVEKDAWLAVNETLKGLGQPGNDSLKTALAETTAPQMEIDNDLIKALVNQLEQSNRNRQAEAAAKVVKEDNGQIKAMVFAENKAPLFANYENVINITVASSQTGGVKVDMTGGSVKKAGDHYVAIPDGKHAETTLTIRQNGKVLARTSYKVMQLPAPTPYLTYTTASGKTREYRSNVPLNRKELATIGEIRLKMDGGIDTKEYVNGFDMVVIKNGNKTVMTEHSNSGKLTGNMKEMIKTVVKGDKLFFTNITVKGKLTPARQVVSLNVLPM